MNDLTDPQRAAWLSTLLVVAETKANRHAFIDGYNGVGCTKPATKAKKDWHARGIEAAKHLHGPGRHA